MGDRWSLSSKTVCPVCGEKIRRGRDSYACPAPTFTPVHFACHYRPAEMAVTNGQEASE